MAKVYVAFRIEQEDLKKLQELCRLLNVSLSALIRYIIRSSIKDLDALKKFAGINMREVEKDVRVLERLP